MGGLQLGGRRRNAGDGARANARSGLKEGESFKLFKGLPIIYIYIIDKMATAFLNIFEPSIVKNIYEFALIEPTLAHVLFQDHPMCKEDDFS